ncbi:ABC-2 type transport system ATP-binding protein [Singulisphaera sp. GP187]|uniref:ABC transporter ATP-binding protein n=1 Tax=Singulisphaera sp. GP187 TaxID=1882752 RepID=UPI000929C72E|nr:ABC transporter ATP-binding protein [Singulisphaera sp. GP187]SIO57574.1 ABC-2 type transport system ATP-binding protein [Singulisphaera sp. GP187]
MDEPVIATQGLTKRYGRFTALSDVTLEVRKGEVLGLLGPNGAGKTTFIRLLLGMLYPTAGGATVAGLDPWRQGRDVRRLVSFLPGEIRLYGHLTGLKMLRYMSDLREGIGLDRAVALAERVMGLDLTRKVRTYSTGMKQKLALAQAFADPVEIIILDEPTSALDPTVRGDVIALVREAKTNGQTVVFSGHVLSEVEAVSDRVAIMRRGRLMHVEDMHARHGLRMVLARYQGGVPESFPEELGLIARKRDGDTVLWEHRGVISPLMTWIGAQPIVDIAIGTEDLRSLYDRYHGPDASDEDDRP